MEQDSQKIVSKVIEDEMKQAYLSYAMSVIVGRALPDVRDGLKPVHRRILYAMHDLGILHNRAYKKCARIVGETLGKYHPHGDSAVYDSLVRMAQDFSLRYPLIDGQGNFGSIDGDNAAAQRYTEARLTKFAEDLLADIDKKTVATRLNFDETLHEPEVLPAKIPNLLVNGSVGIAVGMATNIPPHNIQEITQAVISMIKDPQSDPMQYVSGPDFPTGGLIMGAGGIMEAYKTGRGKVLVRAKTHIEEDKQRSSIIIDEVPYQVNKAQLIEHIAELVKEKIVTGISDLRDESDRQGMRVVIELKRDAQPQIVLNQLFKHTRLQTTFGIIMLGLLHGIPKVLNLQEMLQAFIDHRIDVITKRTTFDLEKAQKRAHILLGLKKALEQLDESIAIIRKAHDPQTAKEQLTIHLHIDDVQAQAILDMKLQRLTNLEQHSVIAEYEKLIAYISDLQNILEDKQRVKDIIIEETTAIQEQYKSPRKTEIIATHDDIDIESLIEDEDVIITISQVGYCKRVSIDTYKAQNRGGKGIIGATTKQDDIVQRVFMTHSKATILCFTNQGKVHWLKAYQIPESSRTAGGKHIANLIPLQENEKVTTFIPVKEFADQQLILATQQGVVKKSSLMDYSRPRQGGIKGIVLDDNDQLVEAVVTDGKQHLILATKMGMAIQIDEQQIRQIGRVSRGVRGITLQPNDVVIGMVIANAQKTILTITEHGYGKRTAIDEYRTIGRGGKGVINIQTTERNGNVVSVQCVDDEDGILLISSQGIVMRTRSDQISVIGRNTQGVRIMRLQQGDTVAGVSKVEQSDEVLEDTSTS
ncbi:MAG: DNA gyrase subunit A [Candidatus Woesearchaeota archaeon]